MRWKDAIDRSHEDTAVCRVHTGEYSQAYVMVQYFDDKSVRVFVERGPLSKTDDMGRPREQYFFDFTTHDGQMEFVAAMIRLGVAQRNDWMPV